MLELNQGACGLWTMFFLLIRLRQITFKFIGTLEVFRQTLAALEQESKEEKSRLRAEHADCINTQINKDKRDAMIKYLQTIEETPVNAEHILQAVRNFIQVCEHDRVHR